MLQNVTKLPDLEDWSHLQELRGVLKHRVLFIMYSRNQS